jgi:hypothetical protein
MKEIIEDIDNFKDVQFYLITNYALTDMKHFCKEFQLSKYPNITVGRDTSYFFTNYLEITGVPFMAFYGKDKKLTKTFTGKIFGSQIKAALKE